MLMIDANLFLTYLTQPTDAKTAKQAAQARTLFEAVGRGDTIATTTEVVIHEVTFVLTSSRHYGLVPAEAVRLMTTLLRMRGFRFPAGNKQRFLQALQLWAEHPRLGFADAIVAVTAMTRGAHLASFDNDFQKVLGLSIWDPPEP